MAVDLSDCLKSPYGLGECVKTMYHPSITCKAWSTERRFVNIHARRRGKLSYIIIPELIFKTRVYDEDVDDDSTDMIRFTLDDMSNILGEHPEPLEVAAVGWNKGNICQVLIHMDKDGYFVIAPDDGSAGFELDGGHAGIFSTLITFIPNDNPDDDEEEDDDDEEEGGMEDLE